MTCVLASHAGGHNLCLVREYFIAMLYSPCDIKKIHIAVQQIRIQETIWRYDKSYGISILCFGWITVRRRDSKLKARQCFMHQWQQNYFINLSFYEYDLTAPNKVKIVCECLFSLTRKQVWKCEDRSCKKDTQVISTTVSGISYKLAMR